MLLSKSKVLWPDLILPQRRDTNIQVLVLIVVIVVIVIVITTVAITMEFAGNCGFLWPYSHSEYSISS